MQRGLIGFPFPTGKNTLALGAGSTGIGTPYTGVFGNGNITLVPVSRSFTVPPGVSLLRYRVWGGGGDANGTTAGGGGGFAFGVLPVSPGQVIALTVGGSGATSSIGSFVSCTGGANTGSPGTPTAATATVLSTGGNGSSGGGGAGSLFGTGGAGGVLSGANPTGKGSGGGGAPGQNGANTPFGCGGQSNPSGNGQAQPPSAIAPPNIDTMGAGPGGAGGVTTGATSFRGAEGLNGGGGGATSTGSGGPTAGNGGFPGGGAGSNNGGTPGSNAIGGNGLIILEY